VANFVETEQILVISDQERVYSFVQVRGSIPVFWSQEPDITYKPKPRLTATDKRSVLIPPPFCLSLVWPESQDLSALSALCVFFLGGGGSLLFLANGI